MLARDQGEGFWSLCDSLDIAILVRGSSVGELVQVILYFCQKGFALLEAKTDEVFPMPFERGKCVSSMVDAIEKLKI